MFTVFIYRTIYKIIHSTKVYSSLLVLTAGVMLVCATNLTFKWMGFLSALASTLIFVIQNIFSKRLFAESKLHIHNTPRIDKINLLFYSGTMAFILMLPIWYQSEGHRTISAGLPSFTVMVLLFLNGLAYSTQAILAFSLLSQVSPITYSIASLVKRIFVITASIVYFGDRVTVVQGGGIGVTFVGLYLYHLAEKEVDRGEIDMDLKMRQTLPSSSKHLQ